MRSFSNFDPVNPGQTKGNMTKNRQLLFKNTILILISVTCTVALYLLGPVKQDPAYHAFADQNTYLSIPNFWNIVSNIPFVIIGIWGILYVFSKTLKDVEDQPLMVFFVFFSGVFLTGIGSAYYHYNPCNETLFWDRLPMTISFTAFFSIVICEFISVKAGLRLFVPFFTLGIFSLIYWKITESYGVGDLRFYILIQFLPIILTVAILLFYHNNSKSCFVQIVLLYALAKFFEINDHRIFSTNHLISGHSIKHLFSAGATLVFLNALYTRKIDLNTYLKFDSQINKPKSLTN